MSDIATKLTYLNTTKSKLKDTINYTGAGIDGDTTFRNYDKKLYDGYIDILANGTDTLYNNIPKVSGTGSSITLNGTASTKLKLSIAPSELSQSGTPSPSSPQIVHSISGNNTIKIEGKNLLPIESQDFTINNVRFEAQSGSIVINGTATANVTGNQMNTNDSYFPITLEAGTYYFSRNLTDITTGLLTANSEVITSLSPSSSATSSSFTLTQTTKMYLFFFIPNGTTISNKILNIMVSKELMDFVPYVSQTLPLNLGTEEYCKIGNYSDEFIKTTGKNYVGNLSGFTWETNYIQGSVTDYSITVRHLSASPWKGISKTFTDLQAGATMTVSVYGTTTTTTGFSMTVRNSSNQVVEELTHQPSGTRCSYSFTVPSDGKITLRLYAGYGDVRVNDTATFTELQLEYGDQMTSYEPTSVNQLWLKKNIAKISSYNSETITSDYISTTGGLDTGATVYYQATTPDKVVYTLMSDTLKGQIDAIDNVLAYSNETNITQTNADLPFVITANGIKAYENI